jgi:ribosome maturation protein SDO1
MAGDISHDKVKLNLARIKKFGKTFEITIDPDKALLYKKGEADLREVLMADDIYADAKKGQVVSSAELEEVFGSSDFKKVADEILMKGEIQLTSEHRSAEREQKLKKLVHMINKNACDPKTGLPHPITRIELALDQGKINLDYNKTVEEQFEDIITKLRPIIPISIEKRKLVMTIPGQFTGKAYGYVKQNSTILKDDWLGDGSWKVTVELAAGMVQDFIDALNGMTQGQVSVES